MNFRFRIPLLASSSVESGRQQSYPVTDGRDVRIPNVWKLAPGVWLGGRPAVWMSLAFGLPAITIGPLRTAKWEFRFERDFGGHLFLLVVRDGQTGHALLVEGGPTSANGSGALVPYRYPEEDFAKREVVDFAPIRIHAPQGLAEPAFAEMVLATQRAYDGNQFYLVIELPFLRIGRDSNSYVVGVLLSCGVDARAIPKQPAKDLIRREISGYPGAEDPVHRANFGVYSGVATALAGDLLAIATHEENGDVRYVTIGGEPGGRARLADGSEYALDERGRVVLEAAEARAHGLPAAHTQPPAQIAARRRFPKKPQPAGAEITLVVDSTTMPLTSGDSYEGTIERVDDALGVAFLAATDGRKIMLPLTELRVELRDPERVDRLLKVGSHLTVGLHRDRHPMLVPHGSAAADDALVWHRFHAPSWTKVAVTTALGVALLGAAGYAWFRAR